MKAILISDRPKWCALMMNGDKSVEVRKGTALYKATKKLIDEYGYADFYVYCTKEEELFYSVDAQKWHTAKNRKNVRRLSNGVVKFKFRCYKVEEIKLNLVMRFFTKSMIENEITKFSCLSCDELLDYLQHKTSTAIHISDLEIFDRPREISEFYKGFRNQYYKREFGFDTFIDKFGVMVQPTKNGYEYTLKLTKAPQSWCYVESEVLL